MQPETAAHFADRPDLVEWITTAGRFLPRDVFVEQFRTLDVDGDDAIAAEDLYHDLQRNGAASVPLRATVDSHSWTPVDLAAIDDAPPEPATIGGLAYPGRRHVFSGEPESMKTWTTLVLAVEEIRAGRTVVFVDFEMGPREQLARLRDLGLTDDELARFLYLAPSEPMTNTQVRADLDQLLLNHRPSLVVIDAFTGALEIHNLDPNVGVQVERFYRLVSNPLVAHGAALVLLDHLTKSKETRGRYSIGSERKLARVDVHLGFETIKPFGRGKTGLAKILTHKDRPGHLPRPKTAELELRSSADTHTITWEIRLAEDGADPSTFRPTVLMHRVSEYVAGTPADDPPSRNTIETHVGGKAEFVRRAIDALVEEGYLHETTGARGARLLHHVKPFEERDDEQ